jgi:hypothetical protein
MCVIEQETISHLLEEVLAVLYRDISSTVVAGMEKPHITIITWSSQFKLEVHQLKLLFISRRVALPL